MSVNLPRAIIEMMAEKERRIHHYLFHQVRNSWFSFSDSERQAMSDLGWEPPRPAIGIDRRPIFDNNSGEDFLFMHRQMISHVNAKLAQINDSQYQKVEGWSNIPPPGDQDYPVPPPWTTGDDDFDDFISSVKSDDYYRNRFRGWESTFTDSNNLASISLGELGSRLEFSIHNMTHMRWAAEPTENRPPLDPNNPTSLDPMWNDPSYDYLGDTYSSHVNPTFWKLHGWIDDRIEDWKSANGIDTVEWKGKWIGKMPQHPVPESLHAELSHLEMKPEHETHVQIMEKVAKIIADSGKIYQFYTIKPDF